MAKHTLKLLVLLSAFSVAPASAGHRVATAAAKHDDTGCPHERARLEAAAAAAQNYGTTITLTDRVPPDSALLGMGHRSSVFTP